MDYQRQVINLDTHAGLVYQRLGAYSDWFGFSFDIRDKGEFGDNVDQNKYFSPVRRCMV